MGNTDNTIILKFDKTITRLAGYPYGVEEYVSQAKNKISFDKPIVIVFPDQIIRVASSFAQGFFEEILKQTGIGGIGKDVIIQSAHPEVKDSIIKNLKK